MADILSLALPFFGLIFLGFGAGRLARIPENGLAWLNLFIIYVALPALFFELVSRTPIDQIANWSIVLATTLSTFWCFALSFAIGMLLRQGNIPEATMAGVTGAYANVGYMGPGLTLAALGPQATVPTALIFLFDSTLFFAVVPFFMALAGVERPGIGRTALVVARQVFTHPFIVATLLGIAAAALHVRPPTAIDRMLDLLKNAAAPCALFTLGVTIALRPLGRVPPEMPLLVAVKLIVHPLLAWTMLSLAGPFDPVWVYTAVLMAALPPALNAFVMARQYSVYVEESSAGILIGTVASVVSVTAFLFLIQNRLLPADLFR
jgi:malonate transporter and related proteins